MRKLTEIPRNLRVAGIALALVALLIALVAIPNNASPVRAQDTEPPKACGPDSPPASPPEVIDTGKLLLFDAFWDTGKELMRNNLCPAEYEVTVEEDPVTFEDTAVETFTSTEIDVTKTIIQVDDSYEYTLTQDDIDWYRFLADAETEVGVGSTVWWLRLGDNPATTEVEEASDLQLGFFTGRFDSAHWYYEENSTAVEPFEFHFISIREEDSPEHEHGHFYAFEPSDSELREAIWSSEAPDATDFPMWPRGGSDIDSSGDQTYENSTTFTEWVFTKPGIYRLEVHLKGNVRNPYDEPADKPADWKEISEHETETTTAVIYTFHVGPMIDLGVDIEGTLTEPATSTDPAASVAYAVTASNTGDDSASTAMVQVNLPEGLDYVDGSASQTVTHTDGTVAWDIGQLGADATTTLTFTANLTPDGQVPKLTTDAEIRDRTYNEIDRDHTDNVDTVTVSPSTVTKNRPPRTMVSRQVHEQARRGTHVGEPIALSNPDMDALNYSLSGRGSQDFHVDSDGQITVSELAELDYETKWSYVLWLDVSDGMTSERATTTDEVDLSIEVRISLEDVEHDSATLLLEVSDEEPATSTPVTFTTTVSGLPDGHSGLVYHGWIKEPDNDGWYTESWGSSHTLTRSSGEHRFFVQLEYRHNDRWYAVTSNEVIVTWGN